MNPLTSFPFGFCNWSKNERRKYVKFHKIPRIDVWRICPEVRAAVKYDFLSDNAVSTVTMPGVNAYVISGERLNRLGGEFGLGVTMTYAGVDVSLNYDIEVREDYTSQTGMVRARYNF